VPLLNWISTTATRISPTSTNNPTLISVPRFIHRGQSNKRTSDSPVFDLHKILLAMAGQWRAKRGGWQEEPDKPGWLRRLVSGMNLLESLFIDRFFSPTRNLPDNQIANQTPMQTIRQQRWARR